MRGLSWIRKNSGIPSGTATAAFNKNEDNVRKNKRVCSTTTLDTRFDGGSTADLNEKVVGLGDDGKTLMALWADSLPDVEDDEEREDEDNDDKLLPSQRWRERG